jgi:diguanylate cyclase (GGDEF)-like protein
MQFFDAPHDGKLIFYIYRVRFKLRILKFAFFAVAFLLTLSCKDNANQKNEPQIYKSYKDIPGVTEKEINAIEALKKKYSYFVYGADHTTEAFPILLGPSSKAGGYAAELCKWLTDLFGIPFVLSLYMDNWHNLIAGFESGDVHFMGDLIPTEERKETYFMTGTISERSLAIFQTTGGSSIAEIAKSRLPRLAFPRNYALHAYTVETAEYDFESVFVDNYAHAYSVIANGEADAFVTMHTAEPTLARYGDVISETFYPLVFASTSLSTRKAELEPIISVVQKALNSGARHSLSELHAQGRRDYAKNKFFESLTPEELEYIQRNPVVKIATESDNYPLSFYSHDDNKLQGIAFDVMSELNLITGLSFEIANTPDMRFLDLTAMVERGEASLVTVIIRTKEREKSFLLPETPVMRDFSVLISKSEFPNIQIDGLANVTVGLVKGTMQTKLFKQWFPSYKNYKEYDSMNSVFNALEHGDVDMFMAMSNYLLSIENYKEITGYKANVVFDNPSDIIFGFNKNEAVLCSIVDKALAIIDLEAISRHWMNKRYDYRAKVIEAQRPWLIGAIVMSLAVLAMVLILFFRNRSEGKRLEILVQKRTAEIEKQRKLLEYMSLTDPLTGLPNRRNFDMRLDIEWQIAIREKQAISFLMLDIDNFKKYNDFYGHQQGDDVLCIIAKIIEQTPKRPGDFVARWGGEEFAVLLSNTEEKGALKVAEAIRANVEQTYITVSIGVNTQFPEQDSSLESFIAVADKELYKAKDAGRNKVCSSTHSFHSNFL